MNRLLCVLVCGRIPKPWVRAYSARRSILRFTIPAFTTNAGVGRFSTVCEISFRLMVKLLAPLSSRFSGCGRRPEDDAHVVALMIRHASGVIHSHDLAVRPFHAAGISTVGRHRIADHRKRTGPSVPVVAAQAGQDAVLARVAISSRE